MRVAIFVGLFVLTAGCGLGYSIEAQKDAQQQSEPASTATTSTSAGPPTSSTGAEPPPSATATSSSTSTGPAPIASLSIDGAACTIKGLDADANMPPCGNTWDVLLDAVCPTVGNVSMQIESISGRPYPQACVSEDFMCNDPSTGSTSVRISFLGSGDAGAQASSNDCTIASGPTADDSSIPVNATGTAGGHIFSFSASN